jgi:hypothetical protein
MNMKSIDLAQDPDLRSSQTAMQRAARRARELAATTGTAVIVSHNGVIERIVPEPQSGRVGVRENALPYGTKES